MRTVARQVPGGGIKQERFLERDVKAGQVPGWDGKRTCYRRGTKYNGSRQENKAGQVPRKIRKKDGSRRGTVTGQEDRRIQVWNSCKTRR